MMRPVMPTLPLYREALAAALDGIAPLSGAERVDLSGAAGRVLAEPIVADRALPPFDRAQMDGYALRAAEVGRVKAFPVVATIAAGRAADVTVPPGRCVAIATGAPLPPGADAVVPHEWSDRGDPVRFEVTTIQPGHAVHPRGADAAAGVVLLSPGTPLGAHHVGIAASAGCTALPVRRRPRAVVITSGDEVVPVGSDVLPHQIRNSNGPMVALLLEAIGAGPIEHHHVPDEPGPTREAVGAALRRADLLVTVGGVSAGDRDHFPGAFEGHGVTASVSGARIQPGRPILVGRAPGAGRGAAGAVVVALPGNPVSALACTCLFVWPIVRALLGLDPALPWRDAVLAEPVKPNPTRQAFRPAALAPDGRVRVPKWAGSGDLAHTASTHGLVELPMQEAAVLAGTPLRFLRYP